MGEILTQQTENTCDVLLDFASADPSYQNLLAITKKPRGRANVSGPPDAQKSYLLAALSRDSGRPLCLLAADELRARQLAEPLRAFWPRPDRVALFRPRDLSLTGADAVSRELERERLASLAGFMSGRVEVLVLVAPALLQKFRRPEAFLEAGITLRRGDTISPEDLEKKLLALGFEKCKRVENPGEFARRGDIIDLMFSAVETNIAEPAGAQADDDKNETMPRGWRLSFFDDEIDEMKRFDPDSQRSIDSALELRLHPVQEICPGDYDAARLAADIEERLQGALLRMRRQAGETEAVTALEKTIRRDLDYLAAGIHFPALDRWTALIYPDAVTVLDYARQLNAVIAIDEPARVRQRLDAAQADFQQRLSHYLLRGQTMPEAGDAQFEVADVMREIDQSLTLLSFATIKTSGNGFPQAEDITVGGRDADHFHGQDEKLEAYVKTLAAAGERVHILVHTEERWDALRKFAAERGLACRLIRRPLQDGFVYPQAHVEVLGSRDVFGAQRKARRHKDKNALRLNFFSDLEIGDKVVHESNGIGIYRGITNTPDATGTRRDYLTVSYAEGDTLYLPMDQLAQLQKYVGADGDRVRLSRLGSGDWQKQKERARRSIRQLVTDLIQLYSRRSLEKGHRFQPETVWDREFADTFPYEETEDQLRCMAEINADMESDKVMDRLLCGDVGFGKTEVAFRAIFKCVQDGRQAALLAPTTVLAQQHYDNLTARLGDFPVSVGLLSRFVSPAERQKTVRGLAAGTIDIVIGTHRLLSQDVHFKKIGLLVIDEEQRFGVDHKERLKALTPSVDVLAMSATPIPRTLHMSMSGIRDISVIEEPPEDRRPVQTFVMEYDAAVIQEAILRELGRRGQVFYLHNDTHTIARKADELSALLPGARVVSAHGQMTEHQLENVVTDFLKGEYDVLVCTTIIESGVDMPRVNTIIVEEADRLGLAQLYQLRGRVGRSDRQAYAYITYRADKVMTEVAGKRLAAIRDFTELGAGFKIALRDLEVRGAGNLLGAEQHGQLNAIGYDLYTRMLEEEINAAKLQADLSAEQRMPTAADGASAGVVEADNAEDAFGKADALAAGSPVECVFEIALDAYIPASYIPDDGERMEIYRKISRIRDHDYYRDVFDELLDRYGELPWEALALMDIAYVRARAGCMGFGKISRTKESAVFSYSLEHPADMRRLSILMSLEEYKGQLLFNAGTKPFVVYRGMAVDKRQFPRRLRELFAAAEAEEATKAAEAAEQPIKPDAI